MLKRNLPPGKITPVWGCTISGFDVTLRVLERGGQDRYEVKYGESLISNLNYAKAAHLLGESIFHALQCEGKLET